MKVGLRGVCLVQNERPFVSTSQGLSQKAFSSFQPWLQALLNSFSPEPLALREKGATTSMSCGLLSFP